MVQMLDMSFDTYSQLRVMGDEIHYNDEQISINETHGFAPNSGGEALLLFRTNCTIIVLDAKNSTNKVIHTGSDEWLHHCPGIAVTKVGDFYFLSARGGDVRVKWDNKNTVYLTVAASAEVTETSGMCGNNDRNPATNSELTDISS